MLRLLSLYVFFLCLYLFSPEQDYKHFDVFKFVQTDYKLRPERSEVVRVNKSYMHYLKINTFKFNRSTTAFNISLKYKIHIENEMEVVTQAYKFLSNEYRYFPIRYEMNICDVFRCDVIGFATSNRCGNFSNCPILKDTPYHFCNFVPDMSRFPPLIPSGRFMFELSGMFKTHEMWVARCYGEIYRPIPIPDK